LPAAARWRPWLADGARLCDRSGMSSPVPSAADLLQEAVACHQAGQLDAARKAYERLLRRDPKNPNGLNLLGVLLASQGQLAKGIQLMRRAIAVYPPFPDALSNLGKALLDAGQPESALASCDHALSFAPDDPEIHNNRGNALLALGRPEDALLSYRRALTGRPDYAEARTNEGLSLLAVGDLVPGWQSYEHRWRLPKLAPLQRGFAAPLWTGAEQLEGKRLLLHAEQGLGDTLQFCRYAPLAAARGAQVVLEVQAPLTRLMGTLDGVAQIIAQGEVRPSVDLHCPLMSLPFRFGTTLETIPAAVPYLYPNPERVAFWRARLAPYPGRRIGLVWAGNPRRDDPESNSVDQRRSMHLTAFARLARLTGTTLVSLQKGAPGREARATTGISLLDWTEELDDFAETAALVAALDLVIGVDTSVVHLAGAMGRPVWVLNRFDRCWRWLRQRTDSPWYPTMRLFTQTKPNDWAGVMDAVHGVLAAERV
jgi:Tfp pilus assembly protein PilF